MRSRLPNGRPDFEAWAVEADHRAGKAGTPLLAASWRHVGLTYRWIDYHRMPTVRWREPSHEETDPQ